MNGHRPGREDKKSEGWMKPGARKAAERALKAAGNDPIKKPPTCPQCSGVDLKDLGDGWFKCQKESCRRRFFIRNKS
ncbi:hypothetical protein HY634_00790 [Candidatus Uhrbacteria bacterium]|nr:hypothetical protein [Candidatus Uhrbacteria bacterium]